MPPCGRGPPVAPRATTPPPSRRRHPPRRRRRPLTGAATGAATGSWPWTSLRMLIRQPVSFAARLAFWPPRPIASESIFSGTVTLATRFSSSMTTPSTWAGREGLGDEDGGVLVPFDDVDLLAGELGDDGLDPRPALAHRRAHRVQPLLARRHGDLAPAAGIPRDRLDLHGAGVDLRHLQLEQAAQEALVRPADEDLGALGRPPDLEDEGLDVLADPVVLHRGLLGGREDGLGLAEVEDDRPRLDAVDGPGDEVALAAGELVEDDVALGLAEALQHDLLGRLGADPAERVLAELLGDDDVAGRRVGLEGGAPRRR